MTDNEMRIAIAKACGWTKVDVYRWSDDGKTRLPKQWHGMDVLPDYLNDLNAMHEALRMLNPMELGDFECEAKRVIDCGCLVSYMMATPRQLAEAFLKVKGLWKEPTHD